MRKIAMAAVFVGLFSGAAHAQGVATQNVNLTATVGGYCTIDGAQPVPSRSATVPVANGVVTSGPLTIGGASGQVICTLNAKIQLTSINAGLTNPVTVADPFINKIHYTATASYNGATETINTDDSGRWSCDIGCGDDAGGKTNFPLDLAVNITPTPPGEISGKRHLQRYARRNAQPHALKSPRSGYPCRRREGKRPDACARRSSSPERGKSDVQSHHAASLCQPVWRACAALLGLASPFSSSRRSGPIELPRHLSVPFSWR